MQSKYYVASEPFRVRTPVSNKKITTEQIKEIQNRMNDRKTNATALAKEYGISRGLLYQVLKA